MAGETTFPSTETLTLVVPEGMTAARIYVMMQREFRDAAKEIEGELQREVAGKDRTGIGTSGVRTDIVRMKVSEIDAYRQLEAWAAQREKEVYREHSGPKAAR